MPRRAEDLRTLLAKRPHMAGLLVRNHGLHLILFREETLHPGEPTVPVDHVRMSWLGGGQYGLSARDWRGIRWDPMPFAGSQDEILDILEGMLGHLVSPWSGPGAQPSV